MSSDGMTPSLRETLVCFDGSGTPRTTTEVAERLDLGRRSTYDRLDRLVERGRLETKKVGASARVWWRPAPVHRRDDAASGPDRVPGDDASVDDASDGAAGKSARDGNARTNGHDEGDGRDREFERYAGIVDAVGEPVYELDAEGRLVFVNDAFVEYSGYGEDELLGQHVSIGMDDDAIERAEAAIGELVAGGERNATLEFDVVTKDGDRIPAENRVTLLTDEEGRIRGSAGMLWEVTERIERERELERRVRQQAVITDLGQRALEDRDVDALVAEVADVVTGTLGTDYCEVLEVTDDGDRCSLRHGRPEDDFDGAAPGVAVEEGTLVARTLATEEPVVVEDFAAETRLRGPDLLADREVQAGVSVVVGPKDDPWGVLGTYDRDGTSFPEHDVRFVQAVANILATAINRHEYEAELLRQREQLAALNSLYEIVREITEAVVDQSTREDVERTVCEFLAGSDSYAFAWIGDVDVGSQTVNLRAEAGVEGYLDGITISVDPDDERSRGPTGRAFRTGRTQITRDVYADDRHDPWRDHYKRYDFRSSAAIPITHEGTVYGVLNVYAARPHAFEGDERRVLSQLGEVVGHAIAAIERKRALLSDEVVVLDFEVRSVFDAFDAGPPTDDPITFERSLPLGGGEFLVYGRTTVDAGPAVERLVSAVPHWSDPVVREGDGQARFEMRIEGSPVFSALAGVGGSIHRSSIEDGDYRLRIHVSPNTDVRRVTEALREAYPTADLVKRRQVTRTEDSQDRVERALRTDLTSRQRTALEASYHAGFYEWPRETAGEEVARSLDLSPPTFHQHRRKAEQKVFESLLSGATATE